MICMKRYLRDKDIGERCPYCKQFSEADPFKLLAHARCCKVCHLCEKPAASSFATSRAVIVYDLNSEDPGEEPKRSLHRSTPFTVDGALYAAHDHFVREHPEQSVVRNLGPAFDFFLFRLDLIPRSSSQWVADLTREDVLTGLSCPACFRTVRMNHREIAKLEGERRWKARMREVAAHHTSAHSPLPKSCRKCGEDFKGDVHALIHIYNYQRLPCGFTPPKEGKLFRDHKNYPTLARTLQGMRQQHFGQHHFFPPTEQYHPIHPEAGEINARRFNRRVRRGQGEDTDSSTDSD